MFIVYIMQMEVVYGLSSLMRPLVESSSNAKYVGKYVNHSIHGAAGFCTYTWLKSKSVFALRRQRHHKLQINIAVRPGKGLSAENCRFKH